MLISDLCPTLEAVPNFVNYCRAKHCLIIQIKISNQILLARSFRSVFQILKIVSRSRSRPTRSTMEQSDPAWSPSWAALRRQDPQDQGHLSRFFPKNLKGHNIDQLWVRARGSLSLKNPGVGSGRGTKRFLVISWLGEEGSFS